MKAAILKFFAPPPPERVYRQETFFAPRTRTYWCSDCDMLGASATYCVACGSSALLNLGRVLPGGADSIRLEAV
jgi:hypothetical protein